tara:strand:- start:2179 stop:2799 length:621 start_codon:yes stop_codon:yes gene_type:complete
LSISTYTELQTAVADWLARSDLTARIPDFIQMGEVDLNNRLRLREMITTVNITPSQVDTYVSLPTGFLELISFADDTGDTLQEVGYDQIEDYKYGAGSGRPELFAIGARIDFPRTASSALSFPMRYYKRLDLATDETNDVMTNYPNLYLYSALIHSEPFIMNDQRVATWKALYEGAVKEANHRSIRNRRKLRMDFGGGSFDIISGR